MGSRFLSAVSRLSLRGGMHREAGSEGKTASDGADQTVERDQTVDAERTKTSNLSTTQAESYRSQLPKDTEPAPTVFEQPMSSSQTTTQTTTQTKTSTTKPPPRYMETLANEVLLMIASFLDTAADKNALLRTNKQMMNLVTPSLYHAFGKHALAASIRMDRLPIVQALIETYNVDVNYVEHPGGLTPLHLAALYGHAEMADLLLQNHADVFAIGQHSEGADATAVAYRRVRPLHLAARNGDVETARLLLTYRGTEAISAGVDYWKDPLLECAARASALHIAAGMGHVELVEVMLDWGDEPDRVDAKGATPLHYAAEQSRLDVVLLLLRRGADRFRVRQDGSRPGLLDVLPEEMLEELLEDMILQELLG